MSTTMSKYGASINRPLSEIVGLSTDVKPTDKVEGVPIQNGSTFFEMDTNKKYRFDIESKQWNLVDGGGGGGSATLIDKTITANDTYNASDDGADGYSKVVVDVATSINSIQCSSFGRYDVATSSWTSFARTVLKKPNAGVIELINKWGVADDVQILFSTEPINQIIIPSSFSAFVNLTFTPSSNFTGFSSAEGLDINMYGDEITPGDGKCYYAYCSRTENPYQGDYFNVRVKKGSLNFSFVIE